MAEGTNPEGGCLCGAIRYRVTAEPFARSICHCRSCRLASGAPSVAWSVFRPEDFSFVRGEPLRFELSPWERVNEGILQYPRSSVDS